MSKQANAWLRSRARPPERCECIVLILLLLGLTTATAAEDSPAPRDSLRTPALVLLWWQPTFAEQAIGTWASETLMSRDALRHTSCATLSEGLACETRLGLFSAGSPGAWDHPFFLGPGIERLTLWHNDHKTTGPGVPAPLCQTLTPLSIGTLRYVPPDPLIDPLAAGGDGLLYSATPDLRYREVPSAFRFVEGPSRASNEAAFIGRESGATRFLLTYGHASSNGRQFYLPSRSQNIRLQLERATPYGGLYLAGADRDGRIEMFSGGKRYWQARHLTAGAQVTAWKRIKAQARLIRRNDVFIEYGSAGWGRRRSSSTEMNLHSVLDLGQVRMTTAAAFERVRLSTGGSLLEDIGTRETGVGLAMGIAWQGAGLRALGTFGYADPWWYRGHARGRLQVAAPLGQGLTLTLKGWRTAAQTFIPRLESDGEAVLTEGLGLGRDSTFVGEIARTLQHAEGGLRWERGLLTLRASAFARRLEDGLGYDPSSSALLAAGVRTSAQLDSLRGEVTLFGGLGAGELDLGRGIRLFGDLTWIADPSEDALPMLVPAYHGRGGIGLSGDIFKNDLHWRLRFIGRLQGSMMSPYGRIPGWSRLDGELHLTHRSASLFLQVRNIEDDEALAATYENAWMLLPIRSVWTGMEWHFAD